MSHCLSSVSHAWENVSGVAYGLHESGSQPSHYLGHKLTVHARDPAPSSSVRWICILNHEGRQELSDRQAFEYCEAFALSYV